MPLRGRDFRQAPSKAGLRLVQVIFRLCEEHSDVAICFWLVYRDRFAKAARDDGRRQIVILNKVKNLVFHHFSLLFFLVRSFGALRMTK